VFGFACAPDEITAILGILPSRTELRGDPVPETILKKKHNRWIYDAPSETSTAFSEQVDRLMEALLPSAKRFRDLPTDSTVMVFCAVYDYERDVILEVSTRAVKAMSELGAKLSIDYYDLSETGERE
jgi:hypothetical protein